MKKQVGENDDSVKWLPGSLPLGFFKDLYSIFE